MKKACLLALAALALGLSTTGCIGNKNSCCLFRNILNWNLKMHDNEWVRELVFLGLNIVPVYGLSLFADVLIFNSIDFWTGDNPVKGAFASVQGTDEQGNAYAIVPNGDGSATLTYKGQSCTLTREAEGVVVSQDGVKLGTFACQGSLATFTAPDGTMTAALR